MAGSADAQLRERMGAALDLDVAGVGLSGAASLESPYPVSDLAAASVAAAAAGVREVLAASGDEPGPPTVHRDLVDAWFQAGVRPVGWIAPSPWDPLAGDYRTSDGWIRLHTNAPHHRDAALRVIGVGAERSDVERAVALWSAEELESDVVAAGGCAAAMRAAHEWKRHPQGESVAREPFVARERTDEQDAASDWVPSRVHPLHGLRVLDLTRVLAGPVATRLLAGLGAQVLRIDPPGWDEPALAHEVTIGKRTARLDARDPDGVRMLRSLVARADVVVHGYRVGALDRIGLDAEARHELRPGLVDVSLDAYGFTGPWAGRRGFDSLVQMSTGIADAGMRAAASDRPMPLPVQALDHATGYLMAASVLTGLVDRLRTGFGSISRLSLARTALELEAARGLPRAPRLGGGADTERGHLMQTTWGPIRVLHAPFEVPDVRISWSRAPRPLGDDNPDW